MPQLRLLQPLLLFLVSSTPLLFANASATTQALIDWVQSKEGGFVSDKIEIRPIFEDVLKDGPMGVFARQDIAAHETLLTIPRNLYLGLSDEEIQDTDLYDRKDASMDEIMKVYMGNMCALANKLLQEVDRYEDNPQTSEYGPYVAYLQTQPTGQLPATYSPAAKALLRELSGPMATKSPNYGHSSLPPWQLVDWIDEQFVQTGCIKEGDEKAYHAVAVAVQRGFDRELIPVWDMFNHHNEKLNVDTNSLRSPEGLKVWASEDIQAGEELFSTYNYCKDCYDVGDDWGTPGIFRDFGFVEEYPQEWPFLDHKIYYEVVQDEETKHHTAVFHRDPDSGKIEYGVPDHKGLAYLHRELLRIEHFDVEKELMKLGGDAKLNHHEYEMITNYHRSLLIALTTGIEATTEEWAKEEAKNDSIGDEL